MSVNNDNEQPNQLDDHAGSASLLLIFRGPTLLLGGTSRVRLLFSGDSSVQLHLQHRAGSNGRCFPDSPGVIPAELFALYGIVALSTPPEATLALSLVARMQKVETKWLFLVASKILDKSSSVVRLAHNPTKISVPSNHTACRPTWSLSTDGLLKPFEFMPVREAGSFQSLSCARLLWYLLTISATKAN